MFRALNKFLPDARRPIYISALLTVSLVKPVLAQAPLPSIDGNLLRMPVVMVLDSPYAIDWQIVDTNGLIDLLLHDYEQIVVSDTRGAPSFDGEVLNLPRLEVGGASYWGEFTVDSLQPVIFRLQSADLNRPGESGIEGKWRIVDEVDASDCGEGMVEEIFNLDIRQDGAVIRVYSSVGEFEATLDGTSLQWSGSYAEDGGTTTTSIDVDFYSSLDALVGTSSWSFTDGSTSCTGTSEFRGELLHN